MSGDPLALTRTLRLRALTPGGERFAALFRQTWRHTPESVRRRLRRHWGERVWIELTNHWARREPGAMANAELLGNKIRFHAPSMDAASDEDVRFVIAHELAHVLQWADGRMATLTRSAAERDADATALGWLGFTRRPRRSPALRALLLRDFAEGLQTEEPTAALEPFSGLTGE